MGKAPIREDGAPSRHSIPTSWSEAVEPVLLFNCFNAKCAHVSGDYSGFADAQEGQLRAIGPADAPGETLGKVCVAREKNQEFMLRLEFKNRWLVRAWPAGTGESSVSVCSLRRAPAVALGLSASLASHPPRFQLCACHVVAACNMTHSR